MFRLETLSECGSTNDEIKQRAIKGEPEGLAIRALRQTAGRGRMGRVWEDGDGNLMLSLWLTPRRPAAEWATLSLVAAVSLRNALVGVGVKDAALLIKWPNDLLLEGKKLSGMLLEGVTGGVVLGIGVNVASCPQEVMYPATSLQAEAIAVTAEAVAAVFLKQFADDYARWQGEGFGAFHTAWRAVAFARGKQITVNLPGMRLEGVFEDITEEGILLLRDDAGAIKQVSIGDVFL